MSIKILVLEGDGIGPEILEATLDVVHFLNQELDLDILISKALVGLKSLDKNGVTITPQIIENSKQVDGIILGPVDQTLRFDGYEL